MTDRERIEQLERALQYVLDDMPHKKHRTLKQVAAWQRWNAEGDEHSPEPFLPK